MADKDFERLLGVIRSLKLELDLVNQSINSFQKSFSKSGAQEFNRVLVQQRNLAENLNKELQQAQQQYIKLFDAARTGGAKSGATTIPHPQDDEFRGVRGARFTRPTSGGIPDPFAGSDKKSQAAREEEKLVETLRARIASEQKYKQALDQATRLGFNINDLQRVQTQGTGGLEKLQFAKRDSSTGGIEQRYDTMVSQSGRATPTISNQFRSFGQGVVRDIGELTKWSIALAAVYGPMKKLQELTQIMIQNQSALAEATIVSSSSFVTQAKVFDAAADAANKAGEEITGVIDAFTQAYRAAGGGGNEVERFATANKLLSDSLVLSKLSTLDQGAAIDTLSAALRQAGLGLDEGTVLLDKWVAVTKVANVDLTTLATGFAVVGDAAEAAGLTVDELNGIIAAIAETGISSGKETANIARSIVSGFQSDAAQKELENLGISVEDSTGKMRDLRDILQELSSLRSAGVIDDTAFSKLTLAIGGGTRRQAAVSTFVENYSRAIQVAGSSASASGDAQAALAKQLDTVQTSLTRLSNSFEELAQTMGVEGGFLGIIQGGVEGITALVKAFDGLVSLLGKATPAMAAFVATSLILKNRGIGSLQQGLSGIGTNISTNTDRLAAAGQGLSAAAPQTGRSAIGNFAAQNFLGTNASSAITQGIGVALIPALQNAFNKEDKFGGVKAGADIVGGIGGALIGTLVAGSPVIGAAIGVAISEAFVTSTVARNVDIYGFGKESQFVDSARTTTDTDKNAGLDKAVTGIYESIGFGNEALGRFLASGAEKNARIFTDEFNKAIESGDKSTIDNILKESKYYAYQLGVSENELRKAATEGQLLEASPERAAYNLASNEARTKYDIALAERQAVEPGPEISTPFTDRTIANAQTFKPLLDGISEQLKNQISAERLSGDLKGTAYKQQTESVGGFPTKALQFYTGFGEEFEKMNGNIKDSTDLFRAFADVAVYGSQESVNEITQINGEITSLINLLNDPTLAGKDKLNVAGVGEFSRDELESQLKEKQNLAASLATDTYQQAALGRLSVPNVQGDVTKPLTSGELESVKQTAIGLQEEFYKGFLKIPDQLYEGLQKSWEEWAQIIQDSGDAFFETVEGIDPQFFQQAMQKLLEENKLQSQKSDPFGIQQVDLPGSKAGELQSTVDYFSDYLAQNFPQYEQKPEEIGVIFNDYVTSTLHGDNLAIKLALDKLVDLNQKQLDGQYNIPEGATFWVPLTAAYYRNKNGSGDSGMPGVTDTDIAAVKDVENTNATLENTRALMSLTDKMMAGINGPDTDKFRLKNDLESPNRGNKRSDTDTALLLERKNDGAGLDYLNKIREREALLSDPKSDPGNTTLGQTATGGEIGSFIETLKQGLMTMFAGLGGGFQGIGENPGRNVRGGFATAAAGQPAQQSNTSKIDLKLSSTTNLMLDGRVLASSLQSYLANDLIRTEGTQGTITKRYII